MGKEDDTGRVRTKVFAGKDNDTVDNIAVNLVLGCTGTLYKDGTPVSFRTSSYGDGTVLANQAKFNLVSFTDDISSSHACLINKYRDKVLAFITETSVGAWTLRATASTVSELTLSLSPNAQPYLTDPSGKTSGINPVSGIPEECIPGTSMSMGSEVGYLTIENPVNGTYTLTIKDPYSEEFFVSLSYMDSTKTNEKSSWGYIYEQPYSFTFTLNSSITDTIIINYAPPIPGNLRADAVNQDGIKTRLTWNPSTDPSVNAYNVYSKELDSPHLTLITTVVTSTYTTGFPWVTDPSGKERIFAVSAVSSNGDESFLSDPVTNKNVVFLSSPWNLISIPLQPIYTGITTVLKSIEGNYSIVCAYINGGWKLYDPSDVPGSTLKTIDAGIGCWIKTISPGSLSITGTTPPSSISLLAGWNLAGYNKTVQSPASDVLSSIAGKYTVVWAYIDVVWKLYDPSDVPGSTLKTFEPGYGYWIKTTQAVTWSQ